MRKGRKQKLDGAEVDWTSKWRVAYNWNAGVGKYIKKRMNKRVRQEAKKDISSS